MEELPPLVAAASQLARDLGFPLTRQEAGQGVPSACLPGVGRFLSVLAAGCRWDDPAGPRSLVGLLRPGGRVVMDDVTPLDLLRPIHRCAATIPSGSSSSAITG
jgi:hypothetical protein